MNRFAAAALGAAALAASGCTFRFPVVGVMQPDIPMQGEVVVKTNGEGSFVVRNLDGLSCSGRYDSYDTSPTIEIPVTCSDGRQGRVLATRGANQAQGTASAKLDDGTTARFVFGDVDPATRAAMLAAPQTAD